MTALNIKKVARVRITYNTQQIGGAVVNTLFLNQHFADKYNPEDDGTIQIAEVGAYFKVEFPARLMKAYTELIKGNQLQMAVSIEYLDLQGNVLLMEEDSN